MTQDYQGLTAPPELVEQWLAEIWHEGTPVRVSASDLHIATQAARWGADRQLEACCKWLKRNFDDWGDSYSAELRAAMRPKPPSLAEQALEALEKEDDALVHMGFKRSDRFALIRRALERLQELENNG